MAKNNDKGKLLEDIVASFHNDKNLNVRKRVWLKPLNDINGELREIDVLITTIVSGYHKLYIPIECKNYAKQISPNDINAFSGKLGELGLPTNNAIYVSINGYTPKAKKFAKKAGIKLLTVHGLTKDRLSKSLYSAIQSVIYILPVFNSYKIVSSIQNISNNEHLLFYDKNKNYVFTLAYIIYSWWKGHKKPLSLGTYSFTIEVPSDCFNLCNDELHTCLPMIVELIFVGYVISDYGKANHLLLIDDETKKVEKSNINLNFEESKKCIIESFKSEDELNLFLTNRNSRYKLDISRLKFPKVRMNSLFYPVSQNVYTEFKKFSSNSNKSKLEEEQFLQKIEEIEKDICSIWDE